MDALMKPLNPIAIWQDLTDYAGLPIIFTSLSSSLSAGCVHLHPDSPDLCFGVVGARYCTWTGSMPGFNMNRLISRGATPHNNPLVDDVLVQIQFNCRVATVEEVQTAFQCVITGSGQVEYMADSLQTEPISGWWNNLIAEASSNGHL